jgi:large subunit ribosomal protein L55
VYNQITMYHFRKMQNHTKIGKFILSATFNFRNASSTTCAVTKIHRETYARTYPCMVIKPDGSTYTIPYHEPRKIIKLPFDLSTLSDAERKARLEKRKPKQKVEIQEEIEDKFRANKYLKYIKKK